MHVYNGSTKSLTSYSLLPHSRCHLGRRETMIRMGSPHWDTLWSFWNGQPNRNSELTFGTVVSCPIRLHPVGWRDNGNSTDILRGTDKKSFCLILGTPVVELSSLPLFENGQQNVLVRSIPYWSCMIICLWDTRCVHKKTQLFNWKYSPSIYKNFLHDQT